MTQRGYPALAGLLIVAGLALRYPVLDSGFAVDDYMQQAMMRGAYPVQRHPLKLFTFVESSPDNSALRAYGVLPWWTHPGLRASFFRPVSSALMWFDRWFFDLRTPLYHLHSVCWWLAAMTLWAAVLRRLLAPGPALLALALCLAQGGHSMFLGWIANRNALVACTFALLGLWSLLRARQPIPPSARYLAIVAFAFAFLSSEYALGFVTYALTYELVSAGTASQRLKSVVPWAVLVIVYATLRVTLGFGSSESGMYIDPVFEPWAFVRSLPVRLPALIADLVLGVPAHGWASGAPVMGLGAQLQSWPMAWAHDLRLLQWIHLGASLANGVVALLVCVVASRSRQSVARGTLWLVLAFPVSMIPALASAPESRLLLPPLLGWSALVVIACGVEQGLLRSRFRHGLFRALVILLIACELFVPPVLAWQNNRAMPLFTRMVRASLIDSRLDAVIRPDSQVLLVAAADITTSMYLPLVRAIHGRSVPATCRLLSSSWVPQRLVRLADRAFALERLQPDLTPNDVFASGFRRAPFRANEQFQAGDLRVQVERVAGGLPQRTRFELPVSLDHPSIVLLQQTWFGLVRLSFPPNGGEQIIQPPILPFALLLQ